MCFWLVLKDLNIAAKKIELIFQHVLHAFYNGHNARTHMHTYTWYKLGTEVFRLVDRDYVAHVQWANFIGYLPHT